MKILHIITDMKIGGAQRLLVDMLPSMNKEVDVTVLVFQDVDTHFSRSLRESGIKILSLEINKLRNPKAIWGIRKIIKGYDIVHVHLFPTVYFSAIASWGVPVKMVYTEHSTSNARRNKWYFRPIEKLIYNSYDKIISISQQTEDALTEWLQRKDDSFVVVNNGVNVANFAISKPTDSQKRLIMVSRFSAAKDQETVIRALPLINKETTLRFIGDGELKTRCEQIAKELGVADRVEFLGIQPNVADWVAESYIGIQSSHWEGFGLTAVEIMANKKPIIATDVNGLKQVVEGAGLLFPVGDYKQLAKHVNHLLQDKDYYQSIANKCFERAKEYDISRMTDKYIQVYSELLQD